MKTEITENSHDIIGMIADTRKLIQKTLVSGNSVTTTQTRKYIYIYTHIKLIKITTDLGRKENQTCLIKV